ncbi:AbiH family protein [Streptococcus pacificus]|uniref:Phage abortive infection protein n=1 Tax=Streptococcus pacificus TaxID=2740577 RepID=A0ABS0ZK40_9STRE|nr:AbiH family protein [Streptococcus pacificus]MBJ8326380.1 phage abortive infection protein [Streptococcus pacificus]
MADNILILGNGFDLAMKRKTSYTDFLNFFDSLVNENKPDGFDEWYHFQKDTNFDISEYKDNNILRYIHENKKQLGDNWSSIELAITELAEAFYFVKENITKLSGYIFSKQEGSIARNHFFFERLYGKDNYQEIEFIMKIISDRYFDSPLKKSLILEKVNTLLIKDLEQVTELLEIYLSFQEYLDFEVNHLTTSDTALAAIKNIEISKVITFNYTDTPVKLFNIPKEQLHYIHGKIDMKRQFSKINTMVFGIEDKEIGKINSDLIPYQKYYQRIVKETGSAFKNFFKVRNHIGNHGFSVKNRKNIIIFGHSVDPLDKEIFQECFNLTDKNVYGYKYIFTYYDEKIKRSIIKNLTIILGKDKMIELTGERKIAFIHSLDSNGLAKEMLD